MLTEDKVDNYILRMAIDLKKDFEEFMEAIVFDNACGLRDELSFELSILASSGSGEEVLGYLRSIDFSDTSEKEDKLARFEKINKEDFRQNEYLKEFPILINLMHNIIDKYFTSSDKERLMYFIDSTDHSLSSYFSRKLKESEGMKQEESLFEKLFEEWIEDMRE